MALVGPESTGKTTLALRIARLWGGEYSAEGARTYDEVRRARGASEPLGVGDVEPIARGQLALEDAAAARARASGAPLLVRDTDLVSTVAYARHYYGACPAWIEDAARVRRADLYLLCDVDAPWAPDRVRDDGAANPAERARVRDVFGSVLAELGCAVVWVRGGWHARARVADSTVRALLTEYR